MSESASVEVYKCLRCGWCREYQGDGGGPADSLCPVREVLGFESSYARGRVMLARALLEGRLKMDSAVAERAFLCLDCRACEETCPLELRLSNIFWWTKRYAFRAGYLPAPLARSRRAILETGNPFGVVPASQDVVPAAGADVLYLPGCYHGMKTPGVREACEALLAAAGHRFCTLTPPICCGLPLWGMGDEEGARLRAEEVVRLINRLEPGEVVASCPACYAFMKNEYPKMIGPLPFRLSHMTEKLAAFFQRNAMATTGRADGTDGKVTYHDPCHLGRHSGVYEAPRAWLKSMFGERFVEMVRHARDARCCGGSSTVLTAHPAVGRAIARARAVEALEVGADTILTCCPTCVLALKSGAGSRVKVEDLFEVAAALVAYA